MWGLGAWGGGGGGGGGRRGVFRGLERGDYLFSALQDVIGVGNDAGHLLLLHQQGLSQLPVDVIEDQPLSSQVVDAGA